MHYLPKLTAILAPGTGEKNAIVFYYIRAKVLYRNPAKSSNKWNVYVIFTLVRFIILQYSGYKRNTEDKIYRPPTHLINRQVQEYYHWAYCILRTGITDSQTHGLARNRKLDVIQCIKLALSVIQIHSCTHEALNEAIVQTLRWLFVLFTCQM